MKRTFTARGLLLSLVLLIVFFSNAPESHGQESVSYFDYYARGNFEKSWEALQDEVSARPVRQITYRRLDVMIKIAGYVYEQTGAISFAAYHELLRQMLTPRRSTCWSARRSRLAPSVRSAGPRRRHGRGAAAERRCRRGDAA